LALLLSPQRNQGSGCEWEWNWDPNKFHKNGITHLGTLGRYQRCARLDFDPAHANDVVKLGEAILRSRSIFFWYAILCLPNIRFFFFFNDFSFGFSE
jgi:hypothetical protein